MKYLYLFILIFLISGGYLTLHTRVNDSTHPPQSVLEGEERRQVTECLANILWNQLDNYRPFFDMDVLLSNLRDLELGKKEPMAPATCQEQMLSILDKIFSFRARISLEATEAYLAEVSSRKNVVEVIPQKVFYEILHSGNGSLVSRETTLRMHLIETHLVEGKESVFQDTVQSNKPLTITVSDTILGFARGVSGMKTGERRKIYIHPDLAYGHLGRHGFQQLIICDVEILEVLY